MGIKEKLLDYLAHKNSAFVSVITPTHKGGFVVDIAELNNDEGEIYFGSSDQYMAIKTAEFEIKEKQQGDFVLSNGNETINIYFIV